MYHEYEYNGVTILRVKFRTAAGGVWQKPCKCSFNSHSFGRFSLRNYPILGLCQARSTSRFGKRSNSRAELAVLDLKSRGLIQCTHLQSHVNRISMASASAYSNKLSLLTQSCRRPCPRPAFIATHLYSGRPG